MLVNPTNPNAETIVRDVEAAARAMGLQIQVHKAGTIGEIDAAFATFTREQPDALFVATDPFFPRPACPIGSAGGASQNPRDLCVS